MRRPLAAVAVGLAILGGTAVAVLLTQGGKAAPILVPWDSVVKINASGTRIERITGVGSHPVAIALGEGGVWVANSIDGTVSRLNPATGRRAHTPLGINADVSDIAVGFHSVWVAGGNDGTITQIDPHLNTVENTITPRGGPALAPNAVFYVATGLGYVWATRGSQLLRIDPSTGLVSRKRLTVGTPTGLTTGGGSVWVTTQTTLLRIDPRTVQKETQESVTSAAEPVYTRGFLWLLLGFEVQQVDPASLASDRTITMKGYPTALASGNGALWTLSINSNSATATARLTRWPLSGGRATALEIGRGATAVAAGGGATWVAVSAPN